MSGTIGQNPNRQSGAIGSIPSATKSASNPTITTNPSTGVGTEWINTTSGDVFLCTDATTDANWWINQRGDSVKAPGQRGLTGGGYNSNYSPTRTNVLEYITIDTPGNGTDFGDLSIGCGGGSGDSNGVSGRGIFYIEYYGNGSDGYSNAIDYFTISTPGNASDFGNTTVARYQAGSANNGTSDRSVLAGGRSAAASNDNTIDYVTISTPGNSTDFGNLSAGGRSYTHAAFSNGTNERGVWSGGEMGGGALDNVETTEYVTISTTGNSTNFGNLSTNQKGAGATSNATNERGIVMGGNNGSYVNFISYFTINSPGNTTDFGDLTQARGYCSALSNGTGERGICCWGIDASAPYFDIYDYVTISSTGNATDFGDGTIETQSPASTSNGFL